MYMNMKILSRRKQTFMQCTNQLRQFGINQTVLILKLTAVAIQYSQLLFQMQTLHYQNKDLIGQLK